MHVDILTLHRSAGWHSGNSIPADAIRALIHSKADPRVCLIDDCLPFVFYSCEYAKVTHTVIHIVSLLRRLHSARQLEAAAAAMTNASQELVLEVHSDVRGHREPLSIGSRKYYMTFTDDHTRYKLRL